MKLCKNTRRNLALARDLARRETSAAWLLAAAAILESIAADIRKEVADQPTAEEAGL